jgi:hypothetical protein
LVEIAGILEVSSQVAIEPVDKSTVIVTEDGMWRAGSDIASHCIVCGKEGEDTCDSGAKKGRKLP